MLDRLIVCLFPLLSTNTTKRIFPCTVKLSKKQERVKKKKKKHINLHFIGPCQGLTSSPHSHIIRVLLAFFQVSIMILEQINKKKYDAKLNFCSFVTVSNRQEKITIFDLRSLGSYKLHIKESTNPCQKWNYWFL